MLISCLTPPLSCVSDCVCSTPLNYSGIHDRGWKYGMCRQILESSFSVVSTPIFATEYCSGLTTLLVLKMICKKSVLYILIFRTHTHTHTLIIRSLSHTHTLIIHTHTLNPIRENPQKRAGPTVPNHQLDSCCHLHHSGNGSLKNQQATAAN